MAEATFTAEQVHDLLRGAAAYGRAPLITDVAEAVIRAPDAPFSNAFNPKQVSSKLWLVDEVFRTLGGGFDEVVVMGGWLGVLSAMLLTDPRFDIGRVISLDLDPECREPALLLNRRHVQAGKFSAVTADMYAYRYGPVGPGARRLIVNTSAEHIADPALWVAGLPPGSHVVIQSNDYRAIPEHVSCVDSAEELAERLSIRNVLFAGALKQKRYTRFMLIARLNSGG